MRGTLDAATGRTARTNLRTALAVYGGVATVECIAAYYGSNALVLVGLILYPVLSLRLVKREEWRALGLQWPTSWACVPWGLMASVIWVFTSFYVLGETVGLTTANFLVIMAKQQTPHVALGGAPPWWQFPVAAIGFATISPLTEEVFFRGLLLRAFEFDFSRLGANAAQAILFGVIHLPYLWATAFEAALFVTMVPLIALMGLVYGWAAQRAESVVAAMVVHSGCNLVLIIVVYALVMSRLG